MKKEPKTAELKIRVEPTFKREIARFAMVHRVDVSDVIRLGVQRVMDGAGRPQPMELLNGR